MRDLTCYARKVDAAQTIEDARAATLQLIDQFQHKDKQQLFKQRVDLYQTKAALQKWAWDLVLVGAGLKVAK